MLLPLRDCSGAASGQRQHSAATVLQGGRERIAAGRYCCWEEHIERRRKGELKPCVDRSQLIDPGGNYIISPKIVEGTEGPTVRTTHPTISPRGPSTRLVRRCGQSGPFPDLRFRSTGQYWGAG